MDFNNYCRIRLLNTGYKLNAEMLAGGLRPLLERLLSDEESGFRPNRSCMDCILTLS